MANSTISTRISLAGSDEVKKQLADLGATGEQALQKISDAGNKAGQQAGQGIQDGLAGVADTAQKAGDAASASLDRVSAAARQVGAATAASLDPLKGSLGSLGEAASVAFGKVKDDSKQASEGPGELGKLFDKIKEAISKAVDSAKGFADKVKGSSQGTDAFQKALSAAQAAMDPLTGKFVTTGTALGKFADQFKALPEGTQKSQLALQLFGDRASSLTPILNQGVSGVGSLVTALTGFGLGTTGAIVKAEQFGVALRNFGDVSQRVGSHLVSIGALSLVAADLVAVGMAKMGVSAIKAAEDIRKAAEAAGASASAFQSLQFAAQRSGVSGNVFGGLMSQINDAIITMRSGEEGLKKLGSSASAAGVQVLSSANSYGQFSTQVKGLTQSVNDSGVIVLGFGQKIQGANSKLSELQQALVLVGAVFDPVTGKINTSDQAFVQLAEKFSKIPEGADKARLALDLFGKNASELTPFLNKGKDGIDGLRNELSRLGIGLTEAEFATSKLAQQAFANLSSSVGLLKDKLGVLFAPALAAGADALRGKIEQNAAAIQKFASDVVTKATDIVIQFYSALTGQGNGQPSPAIQAAADGFLKFVSDVQGGWEIIKAVFGAISTGAQFVADAINAVFGTKLTGGAILIAAAFLQVTGVLGLMASAAGVLLPILAAIFTPAGAIAAGVVILAALIISHWGEIKAQVTDILNNLATAGQKAWDAIGAALTGAWNGAIDGLKSAWEGFTSWLSAKIDTIGKWLSDLGSKAAKVVSNIGSSGGDAAGGSGAGAFASGGHVRGPGTGTSDSIFARLSDGEFVIRAAAVSHYGPKLFELLNRMHLPAGALPGFADGGLVGRVSGLSNALSSFAASWNLPRYAEGGLANLSSGMSAALGSLVLAPTFNLPAPAGAAGGGGRPVHITIGGETFGPMMGPDDVAKGLERKAASQQMASSMKRTQGWRR